MQFLITEKGEGVGLHSARLHLAIKTKKSRFFRRLIG